jgi:hypothetical protein
MPGWDRGSEDGEVMDAVVGAILVVVGAAMFCFGPRIARLGISLRYSYEELHARSGPAHRRIQRTTIVAIVLTMAVGAAFIAMGVRGLLV